MSSGSAIGNAVGKSGEGARKTFFPLNIFGTCSRHISSFFQKMNTLTYYQVQKPFLYKMMIIVVKSNNRPQAIDIVIWIAFRYRSLKIWNPSDDVVILNFFPFGALVYIDMYSKFSFNVVDSSVTWSEMMYYETQFYHRLIDRNKLYLQHLISIINKWHWPKHNSRTCHTPTRNSKFIFSSATRIHHLGSFVPISSLLISTLTIFTMHATFFINQPKSLIAGDRA